VPKKYADCGIPKKPAQVYGNTSIQIEKAPGCGTEAEIPWRVTHPAIRQCHRTVKVST
jgi:hypothetical protein